MSDSGSVVELVKQYRDLSVKPEQTPNDRYVQKVLAYRIALFVADQAGKTRQEFIEQRRLQREAETIAREQGLSDMGVFIAGCAAVAKLEDVTETEFAEALADTITQIETVIHAGVREAMRKGFWPWPKQEEMSL